MPAKPTMLTMSNIYTSQLCKPGAMGAFRGRAPKSMLVPPKQEMCPPSEIMPQKKVAALVPRAGISRLRPPKSLLVPSKRE